MPSIIVWMLKRIYSDKPAALGVRLLMGSAVYGFNYMYITILEMKW